MTMPSAAWQSANQTALLAALQPVYAALCHYIGQATPDPAPPLLPPLDPPAALDRLTGMFAILFVIAGAALLAIASGLVVSRSTSVAAATAQASSSQGLQARLAQAEAQIHDLQSQLKTSSGPPSLSRRPPARCPAPP